MKNKPLTQVEELLGRELLEQMPFNIAVIDRDAVLARIRGILN